MNAARATRLSSLSIFFPAYNDGRTIADLVFRAQRIARQLTGDFEIIVVNDGSCDDTSHANPRDERARTVAARQPKARSNAATAVPGVTRRPAVASPFSRAESVVRSASFEAEPMCPTRK